MPLTKVQRRVLEQAVRDHEIVIGGLDASVPRVRWDVLMRLYGLGYVKWSAGPSLHSEYFAVTDEGKAALQ